jgi:hypothetical protein
MLPYNRGLGGLSLQAPVVWQQQRAQGLNLVVAAIILWNTLELARAIEELRSEGVEMTTEQLRHLSPMDWEHIGLTGVYNLGFYSQVLTDLA